MVKITFMDMLKIVRIANKFKKAIELKEWDDLYRFIDTMFKDAPEDVKNKVIEAVNRAKKYAESGKKYDLMDIAEDMLSVFGLTGEEAEEASKALIEIAENIAEDMSKSIE